MGRLLCLLLVSMIGAAAAQGAFVATNLLRKDFWDADGTINALATANGVVYVGGSFSYVAPKGRKVAAIDAYTGQTRPEFPQIFGSAIRAILDDGSGGWFIGGEFNEVGGLPRTNLVHVRSDNSVDPDFRPDPNGAVFALASDGSTLFVGGDFTSIGGQPRSHLASISFSNNLVTSWAPQPDGRVAALLIAEDRVYAGGYFSSIGGQGAEHLAALDLQTGLSLPWFPLPDGAVLTMGLLDGRLFVGGSFNVIGGAFRDRAAAVDVQTGEATLWDPQPAGGDVTSLRAVCDTIYLGGYFTHVHGTNRFRVAAVDSDFGLPTAWDAGLSPTRGGNLSSYVLALELSGDTLYICGEYEIPGNPSRRDLAAVDARTGQLLPWNPNLDGGVSALAVAGRTLLAGFVSAPGGVERRNLAAFDAFTGKVTGWDPGSDGPVFALAVSGNTVFAGGSFTSIGGQARTRLAALDAGTGFAFASWNPVVNNSVFALALGGNTLYAGGSFSSLGGQVRQRLGALDATTGQVLTDWVANADSGSVRALALSGDTLYVGGSFFAVHGINRDQLAALDPATGQVKSWNPGADGTVRALAVSGNTVFAGGDFATIAGQSRNHLAAIDVFSGQPTAWNPGADAEVFSLAIAGDTIYAAGAFTSLGGQPRFGIAAVDASGPLLDWNPGTSPGNRISALALTDEALFAGGTGLRFRNSPSVNSLAVFPRSGAPVILAEPRDQNIPVGQNASFQVGAGGEPTLFYQWRFNGIDVPRATSATLLLTNVQLAQSGSYEVIVSNALGSVTAEATLTVLVPATITAQPMDFIGAAGSDVVLEVSAMGNPPPIYQWRLNGVNIPGAVFPALTLSNPEATAGGSYQVAVANNLGAVISRVARVVFSSPPLAFADDFAGRGTIAGSSGLGSGSNIAATFQSHPDEPLHAGKAGGKSVWLRWIAPASGIATFETRGSGFDTLLGIHAGNSLSNLTVVAGDDDRGGFLTSRAVFNVINGAEYSIAVDGLAGASGDIVLRWELDTSTSEFPRIFDQPASQTVAPGGTAQFSVFATSATPMTFQWFFGCQAIAGATRGTLTITNAQRRDVGNYRVFVMNGSARVAESLPAALELGPQANSRSFNKLEDLLAALRLAGKGLFAPASGGLGGAPVLVGMGSIVSQTFNTISNNGSIFGTNPCGVLGGHPAWLAFKPTTNGVVQVDTLGSLFNTVLAVYRVTNLTTLITNPTSALVACDDNSAPDGTRSLLRFNATGGTAYLALVDGVNGDRGLANINWHLDPLPPVDPPPNPFIATKGVYNGLFYVRTPGAVHHANSGSFKLTLTDRGTYTSSIRVGGKTYSASGAFNLDGKAGNVVKRTGLPPLQIAWCLDLHSSSIITGSLTATDWIEAAQLDGDRARFHARTNRAPYAGRYTLIIPGADDDANKPRGDGYGTATIDGNGLVRFAGRLGDGARVSQAVSLSANGEWPLYAALYAARGSIISWVNLVTNGVSDDLHGLLSWVRPPMAASRTYPAGFEMDSLLTGSIYRAPVGATNRILQITNGLVTLCGGNLEPSVTNEVRLGLSSVVTNASMNAVTLKFALKSGLFTGAFTQAGSARKTSFSGAVHQKGIYGSGFHLGTNGTGRVTLKSGAE